MKMLQVLAPGSIFEITDVPIPKVGAGEALVRIEAITTCPQWDLHLRHDEPMFVGHKFHYPYTPGQPGHEATGYVEQLGDGVTELVIGDRVSVWRDAGHHVDGCYAQYVARPVEHLIKVPTQLPPEALAPIELAMCVGSTLLLLKEMNVIKGKRIGITGLGPAGLIAALMVRAEGASEVIGFDLSETRRLYAAFALDAAYDPIDPPSSIPSRQHGAPVLDTGVDCVGAKASVEFLLDRVRDTLALFGVQRENYTFSVRHYMNTRLCGYRGHSREAADYAVGLIRDGRIDLSPLTTHKLPLNRYAEGIELLETQKAVKICFDPWAE